MRLISAVLAIFLLSCAGHLPPKECGEHGYSHFVNFPQVERIAEMCLYAYASDDSIRERYDRVEIREIRTLDAKFFVYYDDMMNRQFVIIRGTANIENAKVDGNYLKIRNNKLSRDTLVKNEKLDIWVHKGFNQVGNSVYLKLLADSLLESRYLTMVTGHSMGGAGAVITHLSLLADGRKMGMLYTFGQPKLLVTDGVKKYRCVEAIRFVNEEDVVPLVPPSRFALGLITSIPLWRHGLYRHLGDEVILLKNSKYVYLEYHDAERLRVSSFWRALGRREVSVKDHDMKDYMRNLERKTEVITEFEYENRELLVQ